jgi:hypothetical protein
MRPLSSLDAGLRWPWLMTNPKNRICWLSQDAQLGMSRRRSAPNGRAFSIPQGFFPREAIPGKPPITQGITVTVRGTGEDPRRHAGI